MELVFEMLNTKQFVPTDLCQKTFKQAGGVIGRGDDCDWIIPDRKRHLSNHHALISYRDGSFFLTDTSSNGIQDSTNGTRLRKGEVVRIEHGSEYILGDFEIRARLVRDPAAFDVEVGRPQAAGSIIPDDAFLDLDPLNALDQQERVYSEIEELISPSIALDDGRQRADYARIDMESLLVPELVEVPKEPAPAPAPPPVERQTDGFWEKFGAALGVDLKGLDHDAKEALALNAARLLKQSVGGLQQSLRTRSELKNELRLAQTIVQGPQKNPLKFAVDAGEALDILLQANKPGQLPAEQAISRAFRDLQAHQVALLTASRAAVRGTLEHFSPQQLMLRFERDNKPLIATSGSRWRAYGRYHQALRQDTDWSERLLTRDFAQAYEEQIRLISTLHTDHQG
ncbi:type VI secretion system-associated FHA domain protein TagH [Pseudomonas syringae]|uniref:FHA domain-containing protein n=2 Tax=Pseudomonas syringae TaxID=317 RepID=A0A3M4KLJ8_PSESF|nr:type VI secretion system-associated FHA domain protein TagH [Pseudomonas syringae]EPM52423.1 FHA domain-containing protein [Pseudomonas syringae pv. actinidiae ICMP 19098]EPN14303.1 FHA domain-containing protein [Pseudomonas syringae pv. actinidiae ICMP 19100]EPN29512.1 FHA domain-containing protein [Pseudomonas syringae pv. actinidiae ICMP 19099]EPN37711.1 FHA domain-containing protein [Pseudomonas syringae pv. actinidiae ICMP 18883]EPN38762.1 FHA domain-containing protein [Pseudomonas syr